VFLAGPVEEITRVEWPPAGSARKI
jgi:hypothetical protein